MLTALESPVKENKTQQAKEKKKPLRLNSDIQMFDFGTVLSNNSV